MNSEVDELRRLRASEGHCGLLELPASPSAGGAGRRLPLALAAPAENHSGRPRNKNATV